MLLACLQLLVNLPLYVWLLYLRTAALDPEILARCQRLGTQAQACADWVYNNHMADPQWLAAQFTLYTLVALGLAMLLGWRRPAAAVQTGLYAGLLAAAVILAVAEPGRLPALGTLLGSGLGGLIAWRLRVRRAS